MFYLEGPHGFIHTPAYGKVIDSWVLNNSFLVNDEQSSQRNPLSQISTQICFVKKWGQF